MPDFASLFCCCSGPAQFLPVLPGVGQAGARSVPQHLSFERGEDGQQSGHGSTGGRREIQRFGEGNETSAQMLQLLESRQQIRNGPPPAVQSPNQHHIDLAAARGFQ